MSATTQERIANLKNANNARKVHHSVAGSLVKFVLQESQIFQVSMPSGAYSVAVRIKFTPKTGEKSLVSLFPRVGADENFTDVIPFIKYLNEPQGQDGSVVLKFLAYGSPDLNTFVRAVAIGATSGTFVLL